MNTLLLTMGAAFILVLLALMALGIGYLLTGKSKLKGGSCGRAPSQRKDSDCSKTYSCDLCKKPDDDKKS